MLTAAFWTLYVLFVLLSIFLTLLVLIQKGRGGGLSSAFSGGGGANTAFGSKTGDMLTWATSIFFGLFMLLAIGLNLVANSRQKQLDKQAAAAQVMPVSGDSR